jgi:hypothetical protein
VSLIVSVCGRVPLPPMLLLSVARLFARQLRHRIPFSLVAFYVLSRRHPFCSPRFPAWFRSHVRSSCRVSPVLLWRVHPYLKFHLPTALNRVPLDLCFEYYVFVCLPWQLVEHPKYTFDSLVSCLHTSFSSFLRVKGARTHKDTDNFLVNGIHKPT